MRLELAVHLLVPQSQDQCCAGRGHQVLVADPVGSAVEGRAALQTEQELAAFGLHLQADRLVGTRRTAAVVLGSGHAGPCGESANNSQPEQGSGHFDHPWVLRGSRQSLPRVRSPPAPLQGYRLTSHPGVMSSVGQSCA